VRVSVRLAKVQDKIAAAATRSGRQPSEITLIAVSKGVDVERVRQACDLGVRDFGESRTKEMLDKQRALDLPDVRWHFIGRLQTNKARAATSLSFMVHSVDRVELASYISRAASSPAKVLVQVNVAGDPLKAGLPPESVNSALHQLASFEGIEVHGLMTIGPLSPDPELSRPHFRALRRLMDEVMGESPWPHFHHLSMGMSQDYEVAIEEGATMVRVGSAIFGDRHEGD